jgi:hypothetical protein
LHPAIEIAITRYAIVDVFKADASL